MKENVFICPVCGRIHTVELAENNSLMLFCKNCGASMMVKDGPVNTSSLIANSDEAYDKVFQEGNPVPLRVKSGIPVPMKNGNPATIFVDGCFFDLEGSTERGLNPSLPLSEALSALLPAEAQTVDVEKLRDQLGSVRFEVLTKNYPNLFAAAASDDSYGYYKIRGYLPVYLCLGKTHESIQAFLRDTKECGMVTKEFSCVGRNNEYAAFAVDPSPSPDNCDLILLNHAICDFFTEGLTEKLAATYQECPFPKEREFRICTTWEVWGVSHVTAKNAQQAASLVIDGDEPLPDDNEYVDGSQKLDQSVWIED